MEISGDDIARVVLNQFEKLPKKRKPIVRTHGVREWVPLSGFVIQGGDASMELTMAAQDDATPWELPLESGAESAGLTGRGYFSKLGIVRRKPSRPDAPETLSKSCSDKLAMHQCTSLLSSVASLFFSPKDMYITSLTVPESQYSETACRRAFQEDGRMSSLSGRKWDGGYSFKPFDIKTTSIEFGFSKRITESNIEFVSCNITAVWTPKGEESLIGGVLQGRKQTDARGASMLCRKRMWELTGQLAARESLTSESMVMKTIAQSLSATSYSKVKGCPLLRHKRDVKDHVTREVLQGWTSNTGDTLS